MTRATSAAVLPANDRLTCTNNAAPRATIMCVRSPAPWRCISRSMPINPPISAAAPNDSNWAKNSSIPSFYLQPVQLRFRAQINRPIGDGVRRIRSLIQIAFREGFEFLAGLEHRGHALLVLQIDLAVGKKRRCRVFAGHTLLIMNRAGAGAHATRRAAVGNQVQLIAD